MVGYGVAAIGNSSMGVMEPMDAASAEILSRLASIIRFDIVCLHGIAIPGFPTVQK
jgi:hypothetical protein